MNCNCVCDSLSLHVSARIHVMGTGSIPINLSDISGFFFVYSSNCENVMFYNCEQLCTGQTTLTKDSLLKSNCPPSRNMWTSAAPLKRKTEGLALFAIKCYTILTS